MTVNERPASAAAASETARYDFEIDLDSESTHAKVIRLVGTGKRVLELGCATGYMSRALAEQGCDVVGVELDEIMGQKAAPFCQRLIVGDLDHLEVEQELGQERFDVIVAADVLEHMKDPLSLLIRLRPYLRTGGYVVASLPNVAHGSVRLALLGGRFRYTEHGLLDRTHLRFFTRQTIEQLFQDAGYTLARLDRQDVSIQDSEVVFDRGQVPAGLLDALSGDPDALTYQFLVVAYPVAAEDPAALQREVGELRLRLRDERERIEECARQAELERTQHRQVQQQQQQQIQHYEVLMGQTHTLAQETHQRVTELEAAFQALLNTPPARAYRTIRRVLRLGP